MPCATVHLLTAGRALRAWSETPSRAPFDLREPGLVESFLVGAMAPDIGFVASVDRTVSELAHYVSTGDLVKAMLTSSRGEEDQAFSWGWATHHLTDILIHPMVGRSVGEVLYGDRERRVNASEDEETHVSVEVGLDILILGSDPTIPRPAVSSAGQGRVDVLVRALQETYRVPFDRSRVAQDLELAGKQIQVWPYLLQFIGSASGLVSASRLVRGLSSVGVRTLRTIPGRGTSLAGLLKPRRPPSWLPQEVNRVADEFPDRFQEIVDSQRFENRNLETGLQEGEPVDHPNTDKIVTKLEHLRRRGRHSLVPA